MITSMFLLICVAIVPIVLIRGGLKTLRPLFHLLGILLLLPSFLFASACLLLQAAIERHSLFRFLDVIVSFLDTMYPWGSLVLLVAFITLLAAGFRAQSRRVASSIVLVLALGSAAIMHWVAQIPDDPSQYWFFVPGSLAALIAGCLLLTPYPVTRAFAFQYPGGLCISRHLLEDALQRFQGQSGFTRREMGATGWVWYGLPALHDGAVMIGLELGFYRGELRQISVSHEGLSPAGTDQNEFDGQEQRRAENTRAWLQAKGFSVGSYPWGEVWAGYDPKSDFGGGGIRYLPA